jgi:hypothetical protein
MPDDTAQPFGWAFSWRGMLVNIFYRVWRKAILFCDDAGR